MQEVFVIQALRTAQGSFGGALAEVPAPQLAATVIRALLERGGLARLDHLGERIKSLVTTALGQTKVLRVPGAGTAHGLFFWGFVLLTIGTTLIFVQADLLHPLLSITFLKGNFYLLFSVVLDLAGLVAIAMLLGLAVRRYLVRPAGLPYVRDNALMLGLLLVILVTGFLIERARIAVTELGTPLAAWSPGGLVVARFMAGMSPAALRTLRHPSAPQMLQSGDAVKVGHGPFGPTGDGIVREEDDDQRDVPQVDGPPMLPVPDSGGGHFEPGRDFFLVQTKFETATPQVSAEGDGFQDKF